MQANVSRNLWVWHSALVISGPGETKGGAYGVAGSIVTGRKLLHALK
jgi:hypothetical protein